jgi:LmbE family N-acetylglucosaminyl deacetylase
MRFGVLAGGVPFAKAVIRRGERSFTDFAELALTLGLSTRLHADPDGVTVVLSPHLDDAVLNCWSVLTGPGDVRPVNVFAASPHPGFVTDVDRICGATDSAAHMAERRAEDAEALALAGRTPTNMPFLDRQYRGPRGTFSLRRLDAELAEAVGSIAALYAPAALGGSHTDHRLVRRLALAAAEAGISVHLYADLPYAVAFGWPHWVTGEPEEPRRRVDAYWAPLERTVPAIRSLGEARVVRLTNEQAGHKLTAMRAYRTQLPALDAGPVRFLSNPAIHGFEVFWDLGDR